MRKSIVAIAVAGMSAISTQPAHATDWWLLDANEGKCISAAVVARDDHIPAMVTPYEYQAALRQRGAFKDLRITRDNEGNVSVVRIKSSMSDFTILYAATRGACVSELQKYIDNGTIVAKRELN